MYRKMTHGQLFGGIFGFGIGAQQTGIENVWYNELNHYCCEVIRARISDGSITDKVKIYEQDIRTIGKHNLRWVDIISGGFPCKQTSIGAAIHNKRKGLDGDDSGLWWEYYRVVSELRPTWVVIENPSGVKEWESLITGSLERLGYRVSKFRFKASDFGYPHKRERYIYVANSNGKGLEVARPDRPQEITWYQRLAAHGGSWLSGTPGTIGIFNGLPGRVDRVAALGNALMPKIPRVIFEAINQADNGAR